MRWDASTTYRSRAEWLAARRIGASDVGKILGVRPGAYALWRRLIGRPLPDEAHTQGQGRGLAWERAICVLLEDEHGFEIRRPAPHTLYQGPERWSTISPDAFGRQHGGPWGLPELKTDADPSRWGPARDFERWGPEVARTVPREHALQVSTQMWGLDAPVGWLAVLLPWYDIRVYKFDRDPGLDEVITTRCRAWWDAHVEGGVPVPQEGTRQESRDVAERNAPVVSPRSVRQATQAEALIARQLVGATEVAKFADATRRTLSNQLCESAGRAKALLLGRDGNQGRVAIVRTGDTIRAQVTLRKGRT